MSNAVETRMSGPYRVTRSFITLSILGLGTNGFCQSPGPIDVAPVGYSLDPSNARFSQAGLIRFIDEAASQSSKSTDSGPDSEPVRSAPAPVQLKDKKGFIELAPLSVPNTNTQGIGTGVRPEDVTVDRLPASQQLPAGETRIGDWGLQSKLWVPGGFCHQPLYYEDPMLERHGHVRFPHMQPVVSGVRFFGTIPLMPYLVTLRHPLEEVHTLGAYRPGTAAPVLRYRAHYDPIALRNEVIAAGATAVALP